MKTCTVCRQEKALDDFHKHPNTLDKRQSRCKKCANAARRAWEEANVERKNANGSASYYRRRERVLAAGREYARLHPEQRRERERRWRDAHAALIRERKRQQYAANPAVFKARHYERVGRQKARGERFTAAEFVALCARFGDRCVCCGAHGRLTADHVVPLSQGGGNTIANIQPLCPSCNSTKSTKTIDYRPTAAGL